MEQDALHKQAKDTQGLVNSMVVRNSVAPFAQLADVYVSLPKQLVD